MKEYWWCCIGPVERKMLPWACDFPVRQAVRNAVADMVGQNVENTLHCWSGWGMDQEECDEIQEVRHKHFLKRQWQKDYRIVEEEE